MRVLALTAAQHAIWFAQQLTPRIPYVIAQYVDLRGPVRLDLLTESCARAVRELGPFTLTDVDGRPHQAVDAGAPQRVPVVDLRGERDPVDAAERWMRQDSNSPMDIYGPSLVLSTIVRVSDDRMFWYTRAHHIAMDGYAAMMLMRRTAELYVAGIDDEAPPERRVVDPERIVREDAEYRSSPRFERDRAYWRRRIHDLPPADRTFREVTAPALVVRGRAGGSRDSPTVVVIAAFAAYLARMRDADDVVLSLPVSARTSARLRDSGGSVSNVLPLLMRGVGTGTVRDAVRTARTSVTEALRHQRYRREDIGKDIASAGTGLAHFGPVLNLMLFTQEITLGPVSGRVQVLTTGPTADLSVNIYPGTPGSVPRIDMEANPALYDEDELTGHHRRFTMLLDRFHAATDTDNRVAELDLFHDSERESFAPACGLPDAEPTTLDRILAECATTHPDAVAVRDRGRTVSYREIGAAADRWARVLAGHGLGPESPVAVSIPRSYESVLALWAVARSGAAYVPVDPTHPLDRIRFTLGDSGATLGLTVRSERDRLPGTLRWLTLDEDPPSMAAEPPRTLPVEHPAYVIYTSGSTGVPKGVVVTHDGLANLVREIRDKYAVTPDARVLHFASPSFDTAVVEVLAACTGGATLVIAPPDVYGGEELRELVRAERITHLLSTPSALATVDPGGLDSLELVLVGGEVCPPDLVHRWASGRVMRNAYGPTETTCSVTLTDPIDPGDRVTIGSLMRGVRATVLDRRLRPLPPGAAGELYLATAALARGYHRRPALTGTRFVADPLGKPGSRMFRTGDLVRWTADGTLEFLERTDDQVKIRGFRIELGEIDAGLRRNPDIVFATTIVHRTAAGDPALVSYVMLRDGSQTTPDSARRDLGRFLPEYMVPKSITALDAVPLTPTKKLDRDALPRPDFGTTSASRRAPVTETERVVADVFGLLLGVPSVAADDSFFDLGGDSLSATRVVARLNATLGTSVGVRELFETPTPAGLAEVIDGTGPGSGTPRPPGVAGTVVPERTPLSPSQQYIDRTATSPALYNIPFTVRVSGPVDVAALRAAVGDVLTRHGSLRTTFPDSADGPYQHLMSVEDALPDLVPGPADTGDVRARVDRMLAAPFDVRSEPPLRAELFALGPSEHLLACVIHHIAADGWSLALVARDLVAAYASRSAGAEPDRQPNRVSYPQYSVWRRELLGAEDDPDSLASRQLAFWAAELAGLPGAVGLPLDRPRPQAWTYGAGRQTFAIDESAHHALSSLAHRHHATVFTALRSAVSMLIARLSGDSDVAVGTPVAGRSDPELDDVVGMFVNTVVLRTRVDPADTLAGVIRRSRDLELRAFAHADVQFERVVTVIDPPRASSLHPFFQVALSLNNFSPATLDVDGLRFDITPRPLDVAKCDLHFHFTERHDAAGHPAGIDAELVYATDLFDATTAASFVDALLTVIGDDHGV
ncbi:amino acid adenylation domain-containing protein [Rhodococcus sp. NPDC056960]|uniref:amino acid adenylation domain-containing protein n=1 Tax=Rhodococcus sp. NPDC056960 TaxID=3345982 RepID=UPI00362E5CFA